MTSIATLRDHLDYDPVSGKLTWKRSASNRAPVGSVVKCKHRHGYLVVRVKGQLFLAHRVAWALHFGNWPTSEIDHINHVRDDNRIANLREATRSQNLVNKRNPSPHRGVHWDRARNKWVARIQFERKAKSLGRFDSLQLAIRRRKEAELQIHGHFSPTPTPTPTDITIP